MNRENVIMYFIIGCLHAIYVIQNDHRNAFKLSQIILTIFIWPILTFIFLKEMIRAVSGR